MARFRGARPSRAAETSSATARERWRCPAVLRADTALSRSRLGFDSLPVACTPPNLSGFAASLWSDGLVDGVAEHAGQEAGYQAWIGKKKTSMLT